jgi:hypothetical protein
MAKCEIHRPIGVISALIDAMMGLPRPDVECTCEDH